MRVRLVMPLVVASVVAGCATAGAPPGSIKPAGHAWVLFIDDLHLDFRNTGRIRDLLRQFSTELIKEGDVFALRSSGPSPVAVDWTSDRTRLTASVRFVTGNGLRYTDIIRAPKGNAAPNELRYRAKMALNAAHEMLNHARLVRGRRVNVLYVSNGYDFEMADGGEPRERLLALTRAARDGRVRIFAIDPRTFVPGSDLDEQRDPEEWNKHHARTQATLRALSAETGGLAALEGRDALNAARRIAEFVSAGR